MNSYFLAAAILTFVLGLIHSVLGERLIFRHVREEAPPVAAGGTVLRRRHVRILRVTWHLTTLFAWGYAAIFLWRSRLADARAAPSLALDAATIAILAGSLLTLIGTRGKHPGWIVMLLIAILLWLGRSTG